MLPKASINSQNKDVEPPNDTSGKNRWKLTKKCLFILIGIIFLVIVVTVSVVIFVAVYYRWEPAENSEDELYEKQKKHLYNVGCSPKPMVYYLPSFLHEKDDIGDYEIEERFMVIYQCNDYSSFCGVNGNCTCEPAEDGQTHATAIIKRRNPHNKNSEWQYVHRTLNIMNHTQCVSKAEISVPQLLQGPQLYVNPKKPLQDIGCSLKPEVKNLRSLLSEIDDSDYEIEDGYITIFQCNDYSSSCRVNGICTCEPTEHGQTNVTAIIKFRNRHIIHSEWQYVHRTLNVMNHTQCVGKAKNSVQQLYESQKKLLEDIGCSPKPVVMNMLNSLPEKDDIKLEDYEIEERFIAIYQCNDYSSFCGVNEICRCEPMENGQTNATAIIKFRHRHIKNAEWQYVHRTLNIMNHTQCVGKLV